VRIRIPSFNIVFVHVREEAGVLLGMGNSGKVQQAVKIMGPGGQIPGFLANIRLDDLFKGKVRKKETVPDCAVLYKASSDRPVFLSARASVFNLFRYINHTSKLLVFFGRCNQGFAKNAIMGQRYTPCLVRLILHPHQKHFPRRPHPPQIDCSGVSRNETAESSAGEIVDRYKHVGVEKRLRKGELGACGREEIMIG